MQQILKELLDAEMGQLVILHLLSCTGQLMELSDVEYSILQSIPISDGGRQKDMTNPAPLNCYRLLTISASSMIEAQWTGENHPYIVSHSFWP